MNRKYKRIELDDTVTSIGIPGFNITINENGFISIKSMEMYKHIIVRPIDYNTVQLISCKYHLKDK